MRQEEDFLGTLEIPNDALYGIHSERARVNFVNNTTFNFAWYKAIGKVKQAYFITYLQFTKAIEEKYGNNSPLKLLDQQLVSMLLETANEISEGKYFEYFVVPAIQGGAGTSINMNINEILTNVSLQKMGGNT